MKYSQRLIPWPDDFDPDALKPNNSAVYMLLCRPANVGYIGSTFNVVARIKTHFRSLYHRERCIIPAWQALYDQHGVDAFAVQVLQRYPEVLSAGYKGNRNDFLLRQEGEWLKKLDGQHEFVNINQPGGTTLLFLENRAARYISRRELLLHPELIAQQVRQWTELEEQSGN